nr:ester cyclase [Nakamurella flavida]
MADRYRAYLDCLNARELDRLGEHVREDVQHNGNAFGLAGYRDMLRDDFRRIPDLRFEIEMLVVDESHVAARLVFDCAPVGEFLGLPVHGRRVRFHENVLYTYRDGRIADVRSVIDTVAIAAQLAGG